MVDSMSARVKAVNTHMLNRLGSSIQYKRWKENVYNADTGSTPAYWESPTFDALVLSVKVSEINSSGGRLKSGDCAFSFRVDEFTTISGTNNQGETDHTEPTPSDVIIYDGDTWKTELDDGSAVWKRDVTKTMYQVFARRSG